MHIAFLSPEYNRDRKLGGGLANYLYKVGRELSHRGHKVSIFCLSDTNRHWCDQGVDIYEVKRFVFSYRLRRIKALGIFLPALELVYSARRLERSMWSVHRDNPIDIIQASSHKAPGYTLRSNPRIPLVCRISSYKPMIRSAGGFQRAFAEYLCDWLEIRQVLDSQAAYAPSQLMSDTYARLEGFRPSVIRTPIETVEIPMDDVFYKSKFAGKSYLLYFGTLKLVKGVDLLAEVIKPILGKYPDLIFAFIGRDNGLHDGQKIFDYIRARNKMFENRLIYHPALPKASLYPIVANALGVLMPSRMDNYPNSCLEAMSLEVPVVGTYQSSLDEMIVDGKTGFLANNGDPASFQWAIENLLSLTSEQRKQMCFDINKSIQTIQEEDRVGQLINFYKGTIRNFQEDKKEPQ